MSDQTPVVERADDAFSEAERRSALARNICARLCSERRTTEDLEQIDSLLTLVEQGVDPSTLLGRLFNDRYNEDEGDDLERVRRRTHNGAMRHATSVIHLHNLRKGITELHRQANWPAEENFDKPCDSAPVMSRTRAMDFDVGGEG
jgi:hypothetical protein